MCRLSVPDKLPKTFMEVTEIAWKAFNLGKKYALLEAAEETEAPLQIV